MDLKIVLLLKLLLISACVVNAEENASFLSKSYEYVRSFAPKLWSIASCLIQEDSWACAREKAGKMLDILDDDVNNERRSWQLEADNEVMASGRTLSPSDKPSRAGSIVELSFKEMLTTINELIYGSEDTTSHPETARKKGGGIDSITVMTSSGHMKKKMKKKPPQFHIMPAEMMGAQMMEMTKGAEELSVETSDGVEDVVEAREVGESRGKKKKKKKAILKLLVLGAVLKAKISLLLQILSAKLQFKFFVIALIGLAINIARFWLDVKKGSVPQKVIYYEHAQHQHHYDHEEEAGGWGGGSGGYWSRSLPGPKEEAAPVVTEEDSTEVQYSPYRSWIGRNRQ